MGLYIGGKVGPIGYSTSLSGGRTRRSAPREDDALVGGLAVLMLVTFIGFVALGHWIAEIPGAQVGMVCWAGLWVGVAATALINALRTQPDES